MGILYRMNCVDIHKWMYRRKLKEYNNKEYIGNIAAMKVTYDRNV